MNGASSCWAARLRVPGSHSLDRLRVRGDVSIRFDPDGCVWLTGDHLDDELDCELRRIGGLERFVATDASGTAFARSGDSVPSVVLSSDGFAPIRTQIVVESPRAAFRANLPAAVELRLVRTARVRPTKALIVGIAELCAWVDFAAEVRIGRLSFATDAVGRTIVLGDPLPPLPGSGFWQAGPILVPIGFAWDPPMDASTLARSLKIRADGFAVLSSGGEFDWIPGEALLRASRSAVRATAAGFRR